MKIRITAACHENDVADSNHFAMAMAFSEADGQTYGRRWARDGENELFTFTSFLALPEWVMAAQSGLTRPEWDTGEVIDMAAAARAQAALVVWTPEGDDPPPLAQAGALTAIIGPDDRAALAAMGLVPVEVAP